MTTLTRWNGLLSPWSAFDLLGREFDPVLDSPPSTSHPDFVPAMDVREEETGTRIEAELPGMNPEQIEISLHDKVLSLRGTRNAEREKTEANSLIRERRWGFFERILRLSHAVDPEAIEATYEQGILSIHLPKAESDRPQRITVKSS